MALTARSILWQLTLALTARDILPWQMAAVTIRGFLWWVIIDIAEAKDFLLPSGAS